MSSQFRLQLRPLIVPVLGLALSLPAFAHGSEEFKITASDGQPGAQFGFSVGISGAWVVVGAPLHNGAGQAYIFYGNDPHAAPDHFRFREKSILLPLDLAAGDRFGFSVAISGDLAVVGAPLSDANGTDSGAAYIFVRDAGLETWSFEAKIVELGTTPGVQFGKTVAIDGETVVIGQTNAAWVYVRNGGAWTQEGQLLPSDGAPSFGISVSVSGDRAAVGALLANGQVTGSGAAYVFLRTSGVWAQEDKLWANDGESNELFGHSVSIFNDRLLVGASQDDDEGVLAGAAYLFDRSGSNWNQSEKFWGEETSKNDHYGSSVSYAYNSAWVGSKWEDIITLPSERDQGTANIHRTVNGVTRVELFAATDAAAGDELGFSVSISDCWMISGSRLKDDVLLGVDAGAAYLFSVAHAEATPFNGSNVNPVCLLTTQAPSIGSDWVVEVDATAFAGAGFTQVLAVNRANPSPALTQWGEVLISRPSGAVINSLLPGSGLNIHVVPVPNSPYLPGFEMYAQGLIRSPTLGLMGLCNAEHITIGCPSH